MDQEIVDELLKLTRRGDRAGAGAVIKEWRDTHGAGSLMVSVLEPFLQKTGEEWQRGNLSLAQAYVATKIAEDAISTQIIGSHGSGAPSAGLKGPVVIGNAEGDFHGLGRKMLGLFLQADNWDVRDLGNDVPADEFVETACRIGARVIGVSAMMYPTARNIIRIRRILDEQGLSGRIKLVVGGAVFRLHPELVGEVGGDGTCASATEAPKLFERLWNEAAEKGGCP